MMHLILSGFFSLFLYFNSSPSCCSCLPGGIKQTDPVSRVGFKPSMQNGKRYITVGEKLAELKAHCRKGRLLDGAGREIRFFHLTGCWGNPPEGYQEILDKQARELARLKKRYAVIEMSCNPTGVLIP
jgi:hypothetical protein